jgi:hypothetical protein
MLVRLLLLDGTLNSGMGTEDELNGLFYAGLKWKPPILQSSNPMGHDYDEVKEKRRRIEMRPGPMKMRSNPPILQSIHAFIHSLFLLHYHHQKFVLSSFHLSLSLSRENLDFRIQWYR